MDVSKTLIQEDVKSYLTRLPFYTVQPHLPTRQKQIRIWANLFLEFCQNTKLTESTVSELAKDNHPLFTNPTIKRRLSIEGIKLVLEELHNLSMIEWKTVDKQAFLIFFLNPHEIAELIMKWCSGNAYKGRLATLQWISNGEETEPEDSNFLERIGNIYSKIIELYNLPIETLLKASKILEQSGKVQVIEIEPGQFGLKFL